MKTEKMKGNTPARTWAKSEWLSRDNYIELIVVCGEEIKWSFGF